jgi:hypothetical protein
MDTPPSTTSLVLDIETLSCRQNAVISEIGVIAFNRADFIAFDELTLFPGFFPQIEAGRHLCSETIQFHRRIGTLPRAVGDSPLADTAAALTTFITKHNPHQIWIQGTDFDIPKLDTFFRHCGLELPWKYYTVADSRTVWRIAFPGVRHDKRPHTSIGDCKATLADLAKSLIALDRKQSV